MSAPEAELYVEIRPQISASFEQEMAAEIKKATDSVRQRFKSSLSASAFSAADRSGVIAAAQQNAALQARTLYLTRYADVQDRANMKGTEAAQSATRQRIAYAGLGVASIALVQGVRALGDALTVTGDAALTETGRLRNLAAAAASLDLGKVGQQGGELAALQFQGGAREAQAADIAARKRESDLQRAIDLTAEFVKVREQASKATGQQGTAEGVVKVQLEAQLRALRAQIALLDPSTRRTAFGQLGLGPNGGPNAALIARTAPTRPTDQDFGLRQARAAATKTAADDLALYRERRTFLKGLISRAEEAGATTTAAKANLIRLYGQLGEAEDAIASARQDALEKQQARLQTQIALAQTGVQIQAANARTQSQEIAAIAAEAALARKYAGDKRLDAEQRAGFELQAASADKQIFSIQQAAAAAAKAKAEEEARLAEEEKRQNEEKLKRQRDAFKQLRELRIENNIAKAGLTAGIADDKKAIQAQIRYYRELVKNTTGLEREQARSQLISARGRLQGLKGTATATVGDFFKEVLSDFRTFGSNFASGGGPLSPQQARASFAASALSKVSTRSIEQALAEERTRTGKAQLAEQRRQTALLSSIAKSVGGGALLGVGKVPGKVPIGSMEGAILGAGILHGP